MLSEQAQGKLLAEIDTRTPAETRIIAISNGQEVGKTVDDKLRPIAIPIKRIANHGSAAARGGTIFWKCSIANVNNLPMTMVATSTFRPKMPRNCYRHLARKCASVDECGRTGRAAIQTGRGVNLIPIDDGEDEMTTVVTTEGKPLKEYVEAFERMLIDNTMRRHKGSIAKVMDELRLPRRTLNEKMAKYSLQRVDYI